MAITKLPPPPFNTVFTVPVKTGTGQTGVAVGSGIAFPWQQYILNQHTAISASAPIDSPIFTGVPTSTTAAPLTNSNQVSTTAYTDNAVKVETTRAESAEASNASAITTVSSQVSAVSASVVTETARAEAAEALLAPKASPTFTGIVAMPVLEITGSTPTGAGLGFGKTTGIGNGASGNLSTPALGTGTGPANPGTVVLWLEIDIAGTKYWWPLCQ